MDNYRLPQLVRGWEAGLLTFLRARVVAGKPFAARLAAAYKGSEAMTQVEQLVDAVTSHNIQVCVASAVTPSKSDLQGNGPQLN